MSSAEGKRSALIVSATTYRDPKLKELRSAAVDAEALRRVLADPQVGGFDVATVTDQPEHMVRRKLEAFFNNREADDLLLLHFGCHGIKDADGKLYFATVDTEFAQLRSTAIEADFVRNVMAASRSRRIVLLLDCCYSGAFAAGAIARAGGGVDVVEHFKQGDGWAILTASTAMEYAWEGERLSNAEPAPSALFTAAVVRGLETGEADCDHDGQVSLTDLAAYTYSYVTKRTPYQKPTKYLFGVEGDLYLARTPPLARRFGGPHRDYSALAPAMELDAGAEVFTVAISADNRTVAAGSVGVVLVWHSNTDIAAWTEAPEPVRIEGVHERFVYSVAFSPDGQRLATGGEDGVLHVRHLASGTLWQRRRHDEAVYSVAFSPDGSLLASGGYDRKVLVLDAGTGAVRRELPRSYRVSSVAFSPVREPRLLAVGGLDNSVVLWDLPTSMITPLPQPHQSSVERVVFSPDGTRLASCGLDKAVRLWIKDVAGGWTCAWANALAHEYLVRGIAFSPDGATLASASWDKTVKVWNAETGEPTDLPWYEDRPRHTDWVWSVAFSPDGSVLASSGSDGKIILWHSAPGV